MDTPKDPMNFLNYVLLHRPESIGLNLDREGWTSIDDLMEAADQVGRKLDRVQIEATLAADGRERFNISDDGTRIRANPARLPGAEMLAMAQTPPAHLYYPTTTRLLGAIHTSGLRNSSHHFLHLFDDVETATSLAPPLVERVIITVLSGHMVERGYRFWRDENGVWLTESVPAEFLL
jgi:putative RNA 2'-phosphotransferase